MKKKKIFLKSLFLILIIIILLAFAWYVNGGNFSFDQQNGDIKITQGTKHTVTLEDIVGQKGA